MASLTKRVWKLPSGEELVTWRVEWKEFGTFRRKPFRDFREAVAFMAKLALDLKARKAHARAPVRVDRVVRPRRKLSTITPMRERR